MIVGILVAAVMLYPPFHMICRRAGFHWSTALIVLVPGVGGLAMLFVLGFSEWPALRTRRIRRELG